MTNKKLIFFLLMTSLMLAQVRTSSAVDTLRQEDEDILWKTDENGKVTGYLYELTDAEYDEKGNLVIRRQVPVRSLGTPVQAIPVPEYINAQAPNYDDPTILKVNPDSPRTLNYPIGKERARVDAPLLEPFDPKLTSPKQNKELNPEYTNRINAYKEAINTCIDTRKDELDLEISMLENGNLAKNAAYLSQTFAEIENCYDGIGLDILEEFYPNDTEKLRQYNRQVKSFHVNSADVSFNAKYCQENCSLQAVAETQMENFMHFKSYLFDLLKSAPVKKAEEPKEIPAPNDEIWLDEELNDEALPQKGDVFYTESIYKEPASEVESDNITPPVMMFDTDGVPLIDEADVPYIDEQDL